jgi:hypothetical protein
MAAVVPVSGELAPADLVRLTNTRTALIARPG